MAPRTEQEASIREMQRGKGIFEAIMSKMDYIIASIFILAAALWIVWLIEYNQQVEYEADNPRFPVKITNATQSIYYNGSLYTAINYTKTFNISFVENQYTVFVIRPLNGSDYTNSDIEINKSYIKSITHDENNNIIIISIRKE